jgi:hypothetical protein
MCERYSWIEKDGHVLFLTPYDVFETERGRQLQKHTPSRKDWHGHGAIRWYYDLTGGTNCECTDFSTPANFPPELASAIKDGRMWGFGITEEMLEMLTTAARAEYEKIQQAARAEYEKVQQAAWAEYEKIEQTAWAEYEKIQKAAWAEYETLQQPAWAVYQKIQQPAWAEYDKAKQAAWAEYEKVRQAAWVEYEKVQQPAWAEYDKAKQAAWAEYKKIQQAARAEYETVLVSHFVALFARKSNRIKAWR